MRLPDPRFQNWAHFWKTEGQLYKIYAKLESFKLRKIVMSHWAFDGIKLRKCNFIPRNFIPTPLYIMSLYYLNVLQNCQPTRKIFAG